MANAQDKPNVVVMLGDNVGYGDIGAFGAGEVRGMPTPRIDSIASPGLRLTQYLVEPGCTPSRAALMTGRYSLRSGLSAVIVGGTPNTLQANEVTLGELFKSEGYATAIAGEVAPRVERDQLADPPGLSTNIACGRPRDHGRHALPRGYATRWIAWRQPLLRRNPTSGNPKPTGALKKARPYTGGIPPPGPG